jgi:hypothetical protein
MRVVKLLFLCMLKMMIGLNRGSDRSWSWQALWMLCRHTVLSMQMAEVRWVVYWVTVVVGDGSSVKMACWNDRRLSDSLSSPHVHCNRCRLVTCDPRSLYAAQSSRRVYIRVLMCLSWVFKASKRWVIL